MAVVPELAAVADDVLADAEGLSGAECARAEVTAQEPVQTVGDIASLEPSAPPQAWVPDSSLWTARLGEQPVEAEGSMATSPVVLAPPPPWTPGSATRRAPHRPERDRTPERRRRRPARSSWTPKPSGH